MTAPDTPNFPVSPDFPDFRAAETDATRFMRAIRDHGCCLLRAALPTETLAAYLALARAAYAFREEQRARGELPDAFMRNFYEVGHTLPQDLEAAGGVAGIIRMVVDSPIRPLLRGAMGPEVAFILNNTLPRRVDPEGLVPKTPFHQDATFLGNPALVINFWTPLHACGVTAPGLEVLAIPLAAVEPPPNYAREDLFYYDRMGLEDAAVKQKFGEDRLWHPAMEAGDVLAFTHMTIHRTHVTPEMTADRISLEIRCAPASAPGLKERGFQLEVVAL